VLLELVKHILVAGVVGRNVKVDVKISVADVTVMLIRMESSSRLYPSSFLSLLFFKRQFFVFLI